MRSWLALVVAGCLREAPAPPGGGEDLRPVVVVGDLDNDKLDDMIVLGHDGDPRKDATMFVYWRDRKSVV